MQRPPIVYHQALTYKDWDSQSIFAMLGNIGSEVSRTIKWQQKGKPEVWEAAFARSLELFDLARTSSSLTSTQRGELARAREVWCDFAWGDNNYNSTAESLLKYFDQFASAR